MGDKGYVPDPTSEGEPLRPFIETLVGNPHQPEHHTQEMPVALAQANQYNRDPTWFYAQTDDGTQTIAEKFPKMKDYGDGDKVIPENWSVFRGHWVRVGLELKTWNRREVNEWKGRDEIRPEGEWLLSFNEKVVWGNYISGDVLETLLRIRQLVRRLTLDGGELPIDWRRPSSTYEGQIVGRKIYYDKVPAVITMWLNEQGCVMVKPAKGYHFTPPAYIDEDEKGEWMAEYGQEAKAEMLDGSIWWYRD